MYTCCLQIYLAGHPSHALDVIKKMPSLERFTHIFSESEEPEAPLAAKANVIIADLANMDLSVSLPVLLQNRDSGAQLILLAHKKQLQALCTSPYLENITDIWITPISDEEVRFRFLRWQQNYKMRQDFWQTSHYLDEIGRASCRERVLAGV